MSTEAYDQQMQGREGTEQTARLAHRQSTWLDTHSLSCVCVVTEITDRIRLRHFSSFRDCALETSNTLP